MILVNSFLTLCVGKGTLSFKASANREGIDLIDAVGFNLLHFAKDKVMHGNITRCKVWHESGESTEMGGFSCYHHRSFLRQGTSSPYPPCLLFYRLHTANLQK